MADEKFSDELLESIGQFLVRQMWIGAELGIGNSSLRNLTPEEYFVLNKEEWLNKAAVIAQLVQSRRASDVSREAEKKLDEIRKQIEERLLYCSKVESAEHYSFLSRDRAGNERITLQEVLSLFPQPPKETT